MYFRQAKVAPRERESGFGIRVIFSYGFRNPGSFFLVDSGIRRFGIWNTAQGIRDPTKQ